MAFHIPFNQRASAQPQPAPIYIGFEVQRPPRKKFNWWGFNGMWISLVSLLSAGFFSPVPLLISLVGLRRPGKKMAAIGTFFSLVGIAIATTFVFGSIAVHNHQLESRRTAHYNHVIKKQIAKTNSMLAIASEEITEHLNTELESDSIDGDLTSEEMDSSVRQAIEANMLAIKHIDPWGKSLRFDMEDEGGTVRSAGPDTEFDTRDDVTKRVGDSTDDKVTTKDLMED